MNHFRIWILFCLAPISMFSQYGDKQVAFRELTVEQGLSQNSVVSIAQDSIGFMWFATQDGLNKYDGKQFVQFPYQFEDVTRNNYSKLGKVYVDNLNRVWIVTNSGILHKKNKTTHVFEVVDNLNNVSTLIQTSTNDYFIGTYGSGLYRISEKAQDTIQLLKPEDKHLVIYDIFQFKEKVLAATTNGILEINQDGSYQFLKIIEDTNFSSFSRLSQKNMLFLGSYGKGLFVANEDKLDFQPFAGFGTSSLPDDLIIQDILVDSREKLWVATYGDGVYLIDFTNETIQHFIANKTNPYALHYNDVLTLYEDFTGIVWLGTDGSGLSYYDEDLVKFNVLTNKQAPDNVSIDFVRAIGERDGYVWLGTSNKGLTAINFEKDTYAMYTTQNSNLVSNRVMSLYNDGNNIWIGHQNRGLQKLEFNNKFKTFESTEGMSIWKIYQAHDQMLWLCTLNGLILFDEEEGVVKTYHSGNTTLSSNEIRTVETGDENQLWIGTEREGLYHLNTETETITNIPEVPDRVKSLYYNNGILWIGTNGNGLKLYDTKTKTIKHFTTKQGLANNVVYGILLGSNNNLWLSSNKGLTRIKIDKDNIVEIENFSNYDGLQTNEFNTGAYLKDNKGVLYFGGLEGLNWFNPNQLSYNTTKPKTVITDFKVFAKPHTIVQNDVFSAEQNTMTFTFSGLHYSQPDRNQYKYKLVNHDLDWISSGNNNTAHYTNLPPNDYTFKVISSNYDGVWNEVPATYTFTIKKPWYLSSLALLCYLLFVLCIGIWVYRYLKWRWYMKMQLKLEHQETERLKKIDEFKTKLYTNISHEFRTPLTLISGPVENQLSKPNISENDKHELNLIKRNSKRLLNLVNQLLDLSKLETGNLKLKVTKGNLGVLLKQLVTAFEFKAKEKDLQFSYTLTDVNDVWFDRDVIEKVVSNLLNNAIKYAPKKGYVKFDAILNTGYITITVINNGNNLKDEELPKLFQRYYQNNIHSEGVGVGLSLVKELSVLSHGNIVAHSINNDAIQFTVTLPIDRSYFNLTEIADASIDFEQESYDNISDTKDLDQVKHSEEKPLLLIVEDDQDIRTFVKTIFKEDYKIVEAPDGVIGIQTAIDFIPDVIVSDIMMPKLDGIELCNILKENFKTSHIPIVLLTAKSGDHNEIEGLRTGADAYMTKPFNSEKLKIRVDKLLSNRKKLQEFYGKNNVLDFHNIKASKTEEQFFNKLQEAIKENILQQDFTSEKFSKIMGMSRTQLHRKLKALLGLTTSEFIRNERLKLAINLLQKSDSTVSEIAYQVGFNAPSYFIKCFKEVYNYTPKEYLQNTCK